MVRWLLSIALFSAALLTTVSDVLAQVRCPRTCVTVQRLSPKDFRFAPSDIPLFLSGIPALVNVFSAWETPVQFHRTTAVAASFYNLVSAYDETALDFFGEGRTKILACCNRGDQKLLDTHRSIAMVYTWLHIGKAFGFQGDVEAIAQDAGVPLNKFDKSMNPATPQGWAKKVTTEYFKYTETDGWNEQGQDSRTFNRMPYEDTTGYCPRRGDAARWQPLRSSDGSGRFFEQVHVTPHIGRTARLLTLNETDFASRKAPPPNYRYASEIRKLIRRSAALGRSEKEQAKVELYDAKFRSLVPLLIQMGVQMPSTSTNILDFMSFVLSIDVSAQDAIALVWKEKLQYDLIRPPTRMVHDLGGSKKITVYAGPGQGTKSIRVDEWTPYIGTMPHSEYPSGSSCLCQAAMEVGEAFNGGTDISSIGPTVALEKGTSQVQPGRPKRSQSFRYTSTTSIVADCSNSRLSGGLHFTKATSAAENLCKGLGHLTVDKVAKLVSGDKSGKFGNRRDKRPAVRPAPRRPNGQC